MSLIIFSFSWFHIRCVEVNVFLYIHLFSNIYIHVCHIKSWGLSAVVDPYFVRIHYIHYLDSAFQLDYWNKFPLYSNINRGLTQFWIEDMCHESELCACKCLSLLLKRNLFFFFTFYCSWIMICSWSYIFESLIWWLSSDAYLILYSKEIDFFQELLLNLETA